MSAPRLRSGQAYTIEEERAIRTGRLVQDWTASGVLDEAQRAALLPELQVDLRRTNRFLRITLFVFALMILQSAAGLMAIVISDTLGAALFCSVAAAGSFALANALATRYRLYRFGVEEAAAVAAIIFTGAAAALFFDEAADVGDAPVIGGLIAAAGMSFAIFRRFGYLYAGLAAMACAAAVPFVPGDSDSAHRLSAAAILIAIFIAARVIRRSHGGEFPADTYGLIEAAAWLGIYLVTNLKISSWLSSPEERTIFYWFTYGATWLLPAIGLWLAARERHRALLNVSAVMALVTLTTNKPYLGAVQKPWDPIVFGLFLIAIAIGLRRWLASGEDASRHGFVASRILESEKARVGFVATVSVVHQGPVSDAPKAPAGPAIGGGGRSGGAGSSGSY